MGPASALLRSWSPAQMQSLICHSLRVRSFQSQVSVDGACGVAGCEACTLRLRSHRLLQKTASLEDEVLQPSSSRGTGARHSPRKQLDPVELLPSSAPLSQVQRKRTGTETGKRQLSLRSMVRCARHRYPGRSTSSVPEMWKRACRRATKDRVRRPSALQTAAGARHAKACSTL